MKRMHARRDLANRRERIESRCGPVAGIDAVTQICMTPVDDFPNGVRMPQGAGLGVIVKTDLDVEFARKFFERVDRIQRFGADAIEIHFFRELENLARCRFVFGNFGDAIIARNEPVLRQLRAHGGDRFIVEFGPHFHFAERSADFLAGKQLDATGTGRVGHLQGLKQRELAKRPALDRDRKACLGQRRLRDRRGHGARGKQGGAGGDHVKKRSAFHASANFQIPVRVSTCGSASCWRSHALPPRARCCIMKPDERSGRVGVFPIHGHRKKCFGADLGELPCGVG